MFGLNLLILISIAVDVIVIVTMISLMFEGMKRDVPDGALFGEMLLTIVFILNLIVIIGGKYVI